MFFFSTKTPQIPAASTKAFYLNVEKYLISDKKLWRFFLLQYHILQTTLNDFLFIPSIT